MGSIHLSEMDPVHSQSSMSRNDSSRSQSCLNPPKSVVSARAPGAAQPEKRVSLKQKTPCSKRIVEDWLKRIPGKKREENACNQRWSSKQSEQVVQTSRSSARPSPVKVGGPAGLNLLSSCLCTNGILLRPKNIAKQYGYDDMTV